MNRLALFGGTPVIGSEVPRYRSLGAAELNAVSEVVKSDCLSGYSGSPGEGFLGGPRDRVFEDAWRQRFAVLHAVVRSAHAGGQWVAPGRLARTAR